MSSKFSHRKTRVQHPPKVCISPPKPIRPVIAVGHTLNWTAALNQSGLPPPPQITASGTIVGVAGSDDYTETGTASNGGTYTLNVHFPQGLLGTNISINVTAPNKTWAVTNAQGWTPPLPTLQTFFPVSAGGLDSGNVSLQLNA